MGLEIRQMVVKSTVTREAARPAEANRHERELKALREELLEQSRRLIVQSRTLGKER